MRGIRPALLGLALASLGAAPSHPAKSVLPFILDDYPKALAEARARKVPIFIETTAPW
jgi:hypothetical protein